MLNSHCPGGYKSNSSWLRCQCQVCVEVRPLLHIINTVTLMLCFDWRCIFKVQDSLYFTDHDNVKIKNDQLILVIFGRMTLFS